MTSSRLCPWPHRTSQALLFLEVLVPCSRLTHGTCHSWGFIFARAVVWVTSLSSSMESGVIPPSAYGPVPGTWWHPTTVMNKPVSKEWVPFSHFSLSCVLSFYKILGNAFVTRELGTPPWMKHEASHGTSVQWGTEISSKPQTAVITLTC
jgi:hypothetical protein